MFSLGAVDQLTLYTGKSISQTFSESIRLACDLESIGYKRIWYAEHHFESSSGSFAPEVLIAAAAQKTSQISVGAGGILYQLYSPYKIAEVFTALNMLFPGRIDLGLAGSSVDASANSSLMHSYKGAEAKELSKRESIQILLKNVNYLSHEKPEIFPFNSDSPMLAAPWFLGSGTYSATLAAEFGLPFCFAHFIEPEGIASARETYYQNFKENRFGSTPRFAICFGAIAGETRYEAMLVALGVTKRPKNIEGEPGYDILESKIRRNDSMKCWYIDSGSNIANRIASICRLYNTNDVFIISPARFYGDRLRSFGFIKHELDKISSIWGKEAV